MSGGLRALIADADQDELREAALALQPFLPGPAATAPTADSEREGLLNPAEAASQARCHIETIRRAVRDGKLRARRVGRNIRIAHVDLETWLSEQRGDSLTKPQPPHRRSPKQTPGPLTSALKQSGRLR